MGTIVIGTVPSASVPTHTGTNYIQNVTLSDKYNLSTFYCLGTSGPFESSGSDGPTTGRGTWYGTQTFTDTATVLITEETHNFGVNAPDTTNVSWVIHP
jgi:hypothetical protein